MKGKKNHASHRPISNQHNTVLPENFCLTHSIELDFVCHNTENLLRGKINQKADVKSAQLLTFM